MRNSEEHKIQVAVCQYLSSNRIPHFSVPNGAQLAGGARAWSWHAAEGCKKGVPDLILLRADKDGRPVALEVKTKTGKLSPAQRAMHAIMISEGWNVLVGFGLADCIEQLTHALGCAKKKV